MIIVCDKTLLKGNKEVADQSRHGNKYEEDECRNS